MYNTILFDFDGTVFDTVEGISKGVRYAINKFGMDAPLESLRCFAGPPFEECFMQVFGVSAEKADEIIEVFREYYLPKGIFESQPFPGIESLLLKLRSAGMKLAITTLKPQHMAELLLDKSGLARCFDCVIGCGEDFGRQTKAEIVKAALAFLKSDETDSVLIGDTKYDVLGAHAAGIPVIAVRYGYAAQGELEQAGADVIVDSIEELEKLLLSN